MHNNNYNHFNNPSNIYTVTAATTAGIDPSAGILDNGAAFPPSSGYFLTISPKVGADIAANQFRVGNSAIPMVINFQGKPDSHTQWPSKIEWIHQQLDVVDTNTTSGFKEFPGYYKVVFQDSENPMNAINFTGGGSNKVYVWIYFGRNRTTPVVSDPYGNVTDFHLPLDIDHDADIIEQSETLLPNTNPLTNANTITSFTI